MDATRFVERPEANALQWAATCSEIRNSYSGRTRSGTRLQCPSAQSASGSLAGSMRVTSALVDRQSVPYGRATKAACCKGRAVPAANRAEENPIDRCRLAMQAEIFRTRAIFRQVEALGQQSTLQQFSHGCCAAWHALREPPVVEQFQFFWGQHDLKALCSVDFAHGGSRRSVKITH